MKAQLSSVCLFPGANVSTVATFKWLPHVPERGPGKTEPHLALDPLLDWAPHTRHFMEPAQPLFEAGNVTAISRMTELGLRGRHGQHRSHDEPALTVSYPSASLDEVLASQQAQKLQGPRDLPTMHSANAAIHPVDS